MNKVYLSLGSNINNKKENLDRAVDILRNHENIHKLKVSSYYATAPVGYLDQDDFINIAAFVETDLDPMALLNLCHTIEEQLHRKRVVRWGPRTIDVDIILFNDIISHDETLTLPHPRAHERAFVLVPLMELNDQLTIDGQILMTHLDKIGLDGIRKI